MAYAKVRESLLDGSRPLDGIIVNSESFFAAHSFGERGYDEGDLDGYRMVLAEARPKNPISYEGLFAIARGVGLDVTDEDTPNGLLSNPGVRAEAQRSGFDGYVGSEVIGNMEYDVSIVWAEDRITLHAEPEGSADFSLVQEDDGALVIRVLTARGREAIHRGMDEFEGRMDQETTYVLSRLKFGPGYTFESGAMVAPDGQRYDLGQDDAHDLLDTGALILREVGPILTLGT